MYEMMRPPCTNFPRFEPKEGPRFVQMVNNICINIVHQVPWPDLGVVGPLFMQQGGRGRIGLFSDPI